MKSIEDQIQAMAVQWPGFKIIERFDRGACWEGVLAPVKREYLLQVRYRVPWVIENISLLNAQPRVRVIRPALEAHSDYEEGPIPHVYKSTADGSVLYLCLFDPSEREWNCDDLIAHTTMFWAVEWLYFYEGWLITKKWCGGGRHPSQARDGVKQIETV
jgi:hypothetical protein